MVAAGVSLQDERRKKIEEVETWPKPQSVRDIQVFLGFANFCRGLIGDFKQSKNATHLDVSEQLTNQLGDKPQSTQTEKQETPGGVGGAGNADGAGRGNENLSSTGKLKNRAKPFRNGFSYSRIQRGASNWWSPKSADYQKGLSGSGNPQNFKFF